MCLLVGRGAHVGVELEVLEVVFKLFFEVRVVVDVVELAETQVKVLVVLVAFGGGSFLGCNGRVVGFVRLDLGFGLLLWSLYLLLLWGWCSSSSLLLWSLCLLRGWGRFDWYSVGSARLGSEEIGRASCRERV